MVGVEEMLEVWVSHLWYSHLHFPQRLDLHDSTKSCSFGCWIFWEKYLIETWNSWFSKLICQMRFLEGYQMKTFFSCRPFKGKFCIKIVKNELYKYQAIIHSSWKEQVSPPGDVLWIKVEKLYKVRSHETHHLFFSKFLNRRTSANQIQVSISVIQSGHSGPALIFFQKLQRISSLLSSVSPSIPISGWYDILLRVWSILQYIT